jgi:spore coat polysaccharide biosynthesis protein SpsF
MSFAAIIQARMNSSRLPNKILLNYKNLSPLSILIKRLDKSKYLKKIIIATTTKKKDDKIVDFCKENKVSFFRGNENNVLQRYYLAAKKFKVKKIIRITSDCPLIDFRILDQMIKNFKKKKIDYYSNAYPLPCRYPDGMDIEIFTFKTLEKTFKKAALPSEKEHVTNYMWGKNNFKIAKKNIKEDLSNYRFTIDYKKDFIFLCKIIDSFGRNKISSISMKELINFTKKNLDLISYQKKIKRNQGWKSSYIKDKKFLLNSNL